MKDLLICIAHHYTLSKSRFLYTILDDIRVAYKCDFDIIIDSNYSRAISETKNISLCYHPNLEHPFHLTWYHRKHFKDEINNYRNFLYIEDDLWLPFENYLNCIQNYGILYPSYVPGFIRIEEDKGEMYCADVRKQHESNFVTIGNKTFGSLPFLENYQGFWMMPGKYLKENIKSDFVRYNEGREFAAMFPSWELNKIPMLEIHGGQVSKLCYAYHLPNNYVLGGIAKIKVCDVFR